MKKFLLVGSLMLAAVVLLANPHNDTLSYTSFGRVIVYNPVASPAGVVLMISDQNGWNSEMDAMARRVAEQQYMVVCVNLYHLMVGFSKSKSACLYPASDFENLSIFIQKKFGLKAYNKPILVGKAAGATLTYALIAQSPANTFKGGIALGFSPTIGLTKKFCKGSGLQSSLNAKHNRVSVMASAKLLAPMVAIPLLHEQNGADLVCKKFFKGMANAQVSVPEMHGATSNWESLMISSIEHIQAAKAFGGSVQPLEPSVPASEIADLPFVETDASRGSSPLMALLISGDGGWTDFDQSLADELASRGIPSVGLDTQKYFWEKKSPEKTANDVEKLLLYYSKKFGREKILLMGYSFGADVAPFVANRLTTGLKERLAMVAMLSPDDKTDFEVTISSMLNLDMESDYDVAPEVKKMSFVPKICIYGSDEDEEHDQELFRNQGAQILILKGGHHYGDSYKEIISAVLAFYK